VLALGAFLVVLSVAACGADDGTGATFDPSAPCTVDAQQAGAYPELEALLPGSLEGQEPTSVVSGRTCTTEALGSLATDGITELRFAGATWDVGGSSGYTAAMFEAAGLKPGQVVEFYEAGSKALRPDATYAVSETTVGGRAAVRLDVTGADRSTQTVVAWVEPDGPAAGRVHALLVANLDSSRADRVLEELGGR
jgi:hypothetical protein